VLVVDASVLAPALSDDGPDGDLARARLRGHELVAPDLVDLEVVSVVRRRLLAGALDERRGRLALSDLQDLPMTRVPARRLVDRCWELRHDLTAYDAAYVACAEALGAVLVTADTRMAAAPGPRCRFDVLGA